MPARVAAADDEPVEVLRAEADLHADSRLGAGIHGCGHQVVEGAVQVGSRHVDHDLGDREVLGRHERVTADPGLPGTLAGRCEAGEGQLLGPTRTWSRTLTGAGTLGGHCDGQTADCRSATRSVRSHVNSGTSRPKCPYAAVLR